MNTFTMKSTILTIFLALLSTILALPTLSIFPASDQNDTVSLLKRQCIFIPGTPPSYQCDYLLPTGDQLMARMRGKAPGSTAIVNDLAAAVFYTGLAPTSPTNEELYRANKWVVEWMVRGRNIHHLDFFSFFDWVKNNKVCEYIAFASSAARRMANK
jgi:hypothetical protein